MTQAVSKEQRAWLLARGLPALTLVLIAVIFVPPGSLPYPPDSPYSDAALAHWPNAAFLRQSVLEQGEWPLWNPTRLLGQPFAANPLSKVWYPPQWLVLIFPPTLHLNLMIYGHMALLALGMVEWARAERLKPVAAVFAALGWGLNPKLIAHLGAGHLDIVYALAWTPWLLWAVRRTVDRPSARRAAVLGAVMALLALADLRVAFYILSVGAAYGLALTIAPPEADSLPQRRKVFQAWGVSIILFLLLSAVQLVPLLAISPFLTRGLITAHEAAVFSLPVRYLLGMLFPDLGGFHEWMTYLGLPVMALAGVGVVRAGKRPDRYIWAGIAVLALLWALGDQGPLFMPVARVTPFISWFRVPSRAWLVTALAVVLLGTWGVDSIARHGLGRWGRLAALGLAFAGVVWYFATLVLFYRPPESLSFGSVAPILFGTGLALWLARDPAGSGGQYTTGLGLGLLTLIASLLWVDRTLVEGRPITEIDAAERRLVEEMGGFCDRVYSPSFALIGPVAVQSGVQTLHGADPFQLVWSAEAVARAAGVPLEGYSITAPPLPEGAEDVELALRDAQPDTDLLAALGVGWVISRFPIQAEGLTLHAQIDDYYLYETTGGPPLFIAPEQVDEPLVPGDQRVHSACDESPNRLLEASFDTLPYAEPMVLVMTQSWAPGWRAWVDGMSVPVQRVGGVLLGVELPSPGVHNVEIIYRPAADFVGIFVTGVTLLILLGWALVWPKLAGRGRK
jgi:hypothetical protein